MENVHANKGHSFIGTMGRAGAIYDLLKPEIDSGKLMVDFGTWLEPIIVYGLTDEEAKMLKELLDTPTP